MSRASRRSVALRLAILAALVAACAPRPAAAQLLSAGDPWYDYLRALEEIGGASLGSGLIRPLPYALALGAIADSVEHPWRGRLIAPGAGEGGAALVPDDAGVRVFGNTQRPYGPNEGAVWAGTGVTVALDGGATLALGRLTIAAHPIVALAQNAEFPLAPTVPAGSSIYAYPWRTIDLPERFGSDPIWTLDPGRSSLRIALGGATIGAGTESLWWGPGIQSSILMSDNAPGIPHAMLATSRPLDLGIGALEGQWIWGRLERTEWSDTASSAPTRYVTGLVLALSPKWVDGLHLGLARVFYERAPEEGIGAGELFLVLQGARKAELATPSNPSGDDRRDQMFAGYARWVLPRAGFEAWVEWARNDHGWDFRDYALEPEHAVGRTLGLRKTTPISGGRLLVFEVEATTLERSTTSRVRATPTFYAHHLVPEGYTHRGRLIGSFLGPGGDGQHAALRMFTPWGRIGGFARRRVRDNDAYYDRVPPEVAFRGHDVSFDLGAEGMIARGGVELSAAGVATRELNRYFQVQDDHGNLGIRLEARWRPR